MRSWKSKGFWAARLPVGCAGSPSVPRSAMFGPPKFTRIAEMPEKPANITHMDMVVHTGTHVDAPLHFWSVGVGNSASDPISGRDQDEP